MDQIYLVNEMSDILVTFNKKYYHSVFYFKSRLKFDSTVFKNFCFLLK